MKDAKMYTVAGTLFLLCLSTTVAFFAGRLYERHPVAVEERRLRLTEWSAQTGIPVQSNPQSFPFVVVNPSICSYQNERLLWELADYAVGSIMWRIDTDTTGREVLQYYIHLKPREPITTSAI